MARSLTWDDSNLNECDDGTICENGSKCVRHPYKEGKYICDCLAASNDVFYAGIYCEHKATDICSKGGRNDGPSFCTNNGSCTTKAAGTSDEHVACNCKQGYVGDYCQFVAGSKPSDWQLSHFMHPALINTYVPNQRLGDGAIAGISIGGALLAMMGVTLVFMMCGRNTVFRRNDKEMDTGDARRSGSKKTAASAFVATPDNLDADGGVLTEALEGDEMEEVDLNDLELVEETVPTGELA